MTTVIVTENNEMLSDSMMCMGDYIENTNTIKVENINGYLIGVAGRYTSCLNFKDWFYTLTETQQAAEKHPLASLSMPECVADKDFSALVLDPEGSLWLYESGDAVFEVDKPYAIGTGTPYAMSALDAGADGDTAMNVAIKRDVFSGGDIQKIFLEEKIEEGDPLTYEEAQEMSKEELLSKIFLIEENEEDEDNNTDD